MITDIFMYSKMQIICFIAVSYLTYIYLFERKRFQMKGKHRIFGYFLMIALAEIFFDGLTAITVNFLDEVNPILQMILHLCFYISLESCIFMLFLFMVDATKGLPKKRWRKAIYYGPFAVIVLLTIVTIPMIGYKVGELSNHSTNLPAWLVYATVGLYTLLSIVVTIENYNDIDKHVRRYTFIYLVIMAFMALFQATHPQVLLSAGCVTILVSGIYLNLENPSVHEYEKYREETTANYAALIASRDNETGGHVRRTAKYIRLLAQNLRDAGLYKETLTKPYIKNLYLAAPIHDIGKIAIPDSILKKNGKLTPEEYDTMKQHTVKGGEIIKNSFSHANDEEFNEIAYEITRHHHERFDGTGYPDGLVGEEIPLPARLMAIVDVFDALSEKRHYKEAIDLDKCFEMIREGSGTQFDPILAGYFLGIRDKVEEIYNELSES